MGTAEFWIPIFWLFSSSLLAYLNYRDFKRGAWNWHYIVVTVLTLILMIAVLYPIIATSQSPHKWPAPS